MGGEPITKPIRAPRWSTAPEQALSDYRGVILGFAALHRAQRVQIFGSISRGEAVEGSDLDLLVDFEPGASLLDTIGLQQNLEDQLGIPVDVVTVKALHPLILDRVLREARPL